jgi:hypothetical protein
MLAIYNRAFSSLPLDFNHLLSPLHLTTRLHFVDLLPVSTATDPTKLYPYLAWSTHNKNQLSLLETSHSVKDWTSYLDLSHFIGCIGVFYVTLELESTTTLEFGVFYVAYFVESLSYIFLIFLLNGLRSFSLFYASVFPFGLIVSVFET